MSDVLIIKAAAGQRQLDAAIRMLFSEEDLLAVHTVAAAALGIFGGLCKERGIPTPEDVSISIALETAELLMRENAMASMTVHVKSDGSVRPPTEEEKEKVSALISEHIKREIEKRRKDLAKWAIHLTNRTTNFLKHADRDPNGAIEHDISDTDSLILRAIVNYMKLGFDPTPEMDAYRTWHRAIYPREPNDEVLTRYGPLHSLSRAQQLDAGEFLLTRAREEG